MVRKRIKSHEQFFYVDRDQPDDAMAGILSNLCSGIIGCYLRRMPVFKVPAGWVEDSSFTANDQEFKKTVLADTDFLIREVPLMVEKYPDMSGGFKVLYPDGTIYLEFGNHESGYPIVSFVQFSSRDKSLYTRAYIIMEDDDDVGKMKIAEIGGTPFVMAKKSRVAEEIIKNIAKSLLADLSVAINLMARCLKMFDGLRESDSLEYPGPSHLPVEVTIMRRLVSQRISLSYIPINIKRLIHKPREKMNDNEVIRQGLEEASVDFPLVEYYETDINGCPYLDLSDREWKFISGYIIKKNIYGKDGERINLKQVLQNPKIGKTLRVTMCYDDGREFDVWSHYVLSSNRVIWVFRTDTSDGKYSTFCELQIDNIEDCHPLGGIGMIRTDVIIRGADNMVSSEQELIDIAPDLFKKHEEIIGLVAKILGVYIVSHDKPERTRMVKETKRIQTGQGTKNPGTKEFVIRRILATKDAKKYVAEMTASSGKNYEYTLESWPRVGHYRRLKNGKEIYIPETECIRRLPLSEKDIHIKL